MSMWRMARGGMGDDKSSKAGEQQSGKSRGGWREVGILKTLLRPSGE